MKRKFLTLICSLLAALLCFSAVACTGGGGSTDDSGDDGGRDYTTTLQFAYEASTASSRQTAYDELVKYWNNNVYGKTIDGLYEGKKIDFKINGTNVSSSTIASILQGNKVDYSLIELKEDGSQQVLSLNQLDEIDTEKFNVDDISDALKAAYKMEYVQKDGKTYYNVSSDNAKLYGLPSGTSPSVIFYNTTLMSQSGIAVISMTEEEIAAYNQAHGTSYVARGYHVYSEKPDTSLTVSSTTYNEVNLYGEEQANVTGYRVFNNKIAMNWEELYALAAVFSPNYNSTNPGKAGEDGFASEYWFWLGWSIGGDCLSYDEEAGSLKFTLGETNKNYMVVAKDGVTINGKKFAQGDILDYNARKTLAALEAGSAVQNTTVTKADLEDSAVGDNATVLYRIPSMRDAFTYFCASSSGKGFATGTDVLHNKGVKGYEVAQPQAETLNNSSYNRKFTEGSVAMIYREFDIADKFGSMTNWNIAPAPQYKEFASDNTVKKVNGVEVKGYKAAHGSTTAYAIPAKAKNKDKATALMQWFAGAEVQKMFLNYGTAPYYVANSATVNDDAGYKATFKSKWSKVNNLNVDVLMNSFNYVTPGDWAYTSNKSEWIAGWANFLHKQVETGNKSLNELFDNPQTDIGNITYTTYTNNIVSNYSYLGIVSHKTVK